MMKLKPLWTGLAIVLVLMALVFSVRHFRTKPASNPFPNDKTKGPVNAPIHLVVYSDFQCPACKLGLVAVEELEKQFKDRIRVEFRHYPLTRAHKWALTAAHFAECAGKQKKFWEFHDLLLKNQDAWSRLSDPLPTFSGWVRDLNLDVSAFEACVQDPETSKQIQKEYDLGTKQDVKSTPTFFMNGQILVGSVQLKEKGPAIIAEELKKNP